MRCNQNAITLPSSELLLKIRLCFYSIAFAHLAFTAVVTLSIDMSEDQDPQIGAYIHIRWKLLTCWFNLITMLYFPICLYCDWKERHGQWNSRHVAMLRQLKDRVMTSILFPVTLFADYMFWRMWHKDLTLIAPPRIFTYLPYWAQHSLHTVSMVIMILDLLLVPRRTPHCLWPGVIIMLSFLLTYMSVCITSLRNGYVVYSVFEIFDGFKLVLLALMVITECLFFYSIQWCIIDIIWGNNVSNKHQT